MMVQLYNIYTLSLSIYLLPILDCVSFTTFKGSVQDNETTIFQNTMCDKVTKTGNYNISSSRDIDFYFTGKFIVTYSSYKSLLTYYGSEIINRTDNYSTILTFSDNRDLELIPRLLENKIFYRCEQTQQKIWIKFPIPVDPYVNSLNEVTIQWFDVLAGIWGNITTTGVTMVEAYNTPKGLKVYIETLDGSSLSQARNATLYQISYTGGVEEYQILSQILYLEQLCEQFQNLSNCTTGEYRHGNIVGGNRNISLPTSHSFYKQTNLQKSVLEFVGSLIPRTKNRRKITVDIFSLDFLYKVSGALMSRRFNEWQLSLNNSQNSSISINSNSNGKKVVKIFVIDLDTNRTQVIRCHMHDLSYKVDITFSSRGFVLCVTYNKRCIVKKNFLIYKITFNRGIMYEPVKTMILKLFKYC